MQLCPALQTITCGGSDKCAVEVEAEVVAEVEVEAEAEVKTASGKPANEM